MNNTVLKILAAVLALGAIAVAIIGVRLSQQPGPTTAPSATPTPSATQEIVVVSARPIKAGKVVALADITLKSVPSPSSLAYRQKDELLGKIPLADIPAGVPLQPSQFLTGSMATLLHPGERAIAIAVNEVGGLGGYARPGDKVDILAFAPNGGQANTLPFAQIAVHNARILTIGDISQMDIERAKNQRSDATKTDEPPGPKTPQELKDFRLTLRSAVLAIPESEATRVLLLSENGGELRLALRPAIVPASDPLGIHAAAPGQDAAKSRLTVTLPEIAPTTVRPENQEKKIVSIIIQEGSAERRLQTVEPVSQQP